MKLLFITLTALATICSGCAETEKPNIVFFLTDDQRDDMLGCSGNSIIKTPNIDALAEKGTRFENAFVTTSICAASRASILLGEHERTHKFTFITPLLTEEQINKAYPKILKDNGYQTAYIGKLGLWAEKGKERNMFDHFVKIKRTPYIRKQPDGTNVHTTELIGKSATDFIKSHDKSSPFCLTVGFNAPHAETQDQPHPFVGPETEQALYNEVTIPLPKHSSREEFMKLPKFLRLSLNRGRWFPRWETDEKYQKNIKEYYRMVSGVDRIIGNVIQTLEENNLAENTIIIFSGDNGFYLGARGLAGKWSHFDESIRVPLIVFDPRKSEKHIISEPVLNIDIPSTIIDFAGLTVPDHYQGESLKNFVYGNEVTNWRTETFHEHLFDHTEIPKWEGVRTENYYYARYFQKKKGNEFLHDLKSDPEQLINYANNPEYKEIVVMMRNKTTDHLSRYGTKYNLRDYPTQASKKMLDKMQDN